jgi:hypothetical protein
MVHPIRIDDSPDPLPRGPSIFIPYEAVKVYKDGSADSTIALDLPPMHTIQQARLYIMNNRELASRAISFSEYGRDEAKKNKEIVDYLKIHGVVL